LYRRNAGLFGEFIGFARLDVSRLTDIAAVQRSVFAQSELWASWVASFSGVDGRYLFNDTGPVGVPSE
jgi:hypothetical protein